jgi:high-affinity K+ transport system ATPase subunit B
MFQYNENTIELILITLTVMHFAVVITLATLAAYLINKYRR